MLMVWAVIYEPSQCLSKPLAPLCTKILCKVKTMVERGLTCVENLETAFFLLNDNSKENRNDH